MIDWARAGFTPAIGSSSITSVGSTIRARAISSSLRCPPDSVPAYSSRMWASLNRSNSASARSRISRSWRAPQAPDQRLEEPLPDLVGRPEHHVVEDREAGQRLGQLEGSHHALAGRPVGADALDVLALERPGPGVGPVEPGEQVEQGGLAGAVGPDEGGDRAVLDLQVVDVDRHQAAEPSGDAVGHQDGVGLGGARRLVDAVEGVDRHPGEAAARARGHRSCSAISRRSPNRPWGLKIMSSTRMTPTMMKGTLPTWFAFMKLSGM